MHVPPGRPEGISRVLSGDESDVRRRRQEGQYVGGVRRGERTILQPAGKAGHLQEERVARFRTAHSHSIARSLRLPQHADEHRPERPVLLAADRELGEGAALSG